jgi:hypothetical protein
VGRHCYFGEALGKHSEVSGRFEEDELQVVPVSESTWHELRGLELPSPVVGFRHSAIDKVQSADKQRGHLRKNAAKHTGEPDFR